MWLLIATHLLALAVALLAFALFHHVLPRSERSTGITSSRYAVEEEEASDATLSDLAPLETDSSIASVESDQTEAGTAVDATETETAPTMIAAVPDEPTPTPKAAQTHTTVGYFGEKFSDKFTSGKAVKKGNNYSSPNVNITLNEFRYDNSTVYQADIYIKDIECFRTGFAEDRFGRGIQENPSEIGARFGSLVTINGDYYGARADGVVIRNGELFRNKNITSDVCVLYWDGTLETYSRRQFNAKKAMTNGAYQAWHFGPDLLDKDGKALRRFSDGSLGPRNPRTVLGYYEPGHYCFVVVDGRTSGSDGLTIKVLAQMMSKLGCKRAYNLDGGNSSFMVVGSQVMNQPSGGGRASSDAVMIVDR